MTALRESSEQFHVAERAAPWGRQRPTVPLLEPGRFREPRDEREAAFVAPSAVRERLFPAAAGARVFLVHSRPEPMLGALRPLDTGPPRTRALGFINRGGTLDVPGLLFANRCTWAHAVAAGAAVLSRSPAELLSPDELTAIGGYGDPATVLRPQPRMTVTPG